MEHLQLMWAGAPCTASRLENVYVALVILRRHSCRRRILLAKLSRRRLEVYRLAISSSAPICLNSRNSFAFLNHLPEYSSGVGESSGIRRASAPENPALV